MGVATTHRRSIASTALVLALALLLFGANSAGAASGGLVAAYSFDSGSGSVLSDVSGNGRHGTISGAVWTSAGRSGGALSFDGVNDLVTVADAASLDLTKGMTLEAWVRPTASGSWRTVVTKEESGNLVYGLFSNSDTSQSSSIVSIGSKKTQDIVRAPSGLALSTWTHLATTFDGLVLRVYVNGSQVASRSVVGAIRRSARPLRIGGNNVWPEWFKGQLDDLRIYNRALSASELQADMNTPTVPPPTADTQAPSVPSGLTVSGQTQSGLTLGWNASSDNVGVTGYGAYRNGSGAGSTATSTRTYNFTGLTCGTTYMLGVDAYDGAGNRSAKAQISASTAACTDSSPPSPPAALAVGARTQTSIALSWAAASDNAGVAGYSVYRGGVSQGNYTATSYTFTGLACGTTYTLAVDAFDAAGNRSTRPSLAASTTACTDITPPSPPTNQQIGPVTGTTITMTWGAATDNVGVAGYRAFLNGAVAGTTTALSYTYTGLQCGTTYTVALEAFDAAGNVSNRAFATGPATTAPCAGDTQAPSVPAGLTLGGQTQTSVSLSWGVSFDNVGVAGYGVYNGAAVVGSTAIPSYTVSSLVCGTTYTLGVDAYDGAGNRSARAQISASTARLFFSASASAFAVGLGESVGGYEWWFVCASGVAGWVG